MSSQDAGAGAGAQPAAALVKDGAVIADAWVRAADDAPLPTDAPVLVGKARFLAEAAELRGRNAPVGLVLRNTESLDGLEGDLNRFALIVLEFPAFADGRAYSQARLLRERNGYRGALRAEGDVLWDQIPLMKRCGFDEFLIRDPRVARALVEGRIRDVPVHYQPAARDDVELQPPGARPWLRLDG
ncbi:DUF934 domain-containing protein [Camelimonas abortus]|uniref:DUF934 domain-containing protein n=1 Tax=Camelimonas abortus TaxID=1017184 RepID=A0ABV7LD78_9HYPH